MVPIPVTIVCGLLGSLIFKLVKCYDISGSVVSMHSNMQDAPWQFNMKTNMIFLEIITKIPPVFGSSVEEFT